VKRSVGLLIKNMLNVYLISEFSFFTLFIFSHVLWMYKNTHVYYKVADTIQKYLIGIVFNNIRYLYNWRHFSKNTYFYNICYLNSGIVKMEKCRTHKKNVGRQKKISLVFVKLWVLKFNLKKKTLFIFFIFH
jgi:hypothetical protein